MVNDYMAALRIMALYCHFRDLDDVLLDRLVSKVRNICLQRCLLAKSDLILQMALDEARAAEMSMQSANQIQKTKSPSGSQKTSLSIMMTLIQMRRQIQKRRRITALKR